VTTRQTVTEPAITITLDGAAYVLMRSDQPLAWISPTPPTEPDHDRIDALAAKLNIAEDALADRTTQLAVADEHIGHLRAETGRLAERVVGTNQRAAAAETATRKAQRDAEEARAHLAEANRRNADLRAELDKAYTAMMVMTERVDALQVAADTPPPAADIDDDTRNAAVRDVLMYLHSNGMHAAADAVARQWPGAR